MLSKNQVKYINSLKIKKFRQEHGVFIVEGDKCVDELLNSNLTVKAVFALPEWIDENLPMITKSSAGVTEISTAELGRISDLVTPNKVIAIAEIPHRDISSIDFSEYILALDDIKDPGNMGTIMRTADWFGIRQLVCSEECVDPFNPKVVQASMGSFARIRVFKTGLIQFINRKPKDTPVYGALLNGTKLHEITFSHNGIVVIGSESHGISVGVKQLVTHTVNIPSFGQDEVLKPPESLNASIANAIICYEISKQLSEKKLV
ncbi:MAG TPA: RNA methyltransferase [Bacteroidales bacterium]|nr:RNA methyltransferase [Bacteroidales bacterium]